MFNHSSIIRMTTFLILHALLWVFAIFLADSIWGDGVSQAVAFVFIVVNTILAIAILPKFHAPKSESND